MTSKSEKSGYKRIKSVLHSIPHSMFSMMNYIDDVTGYMEDYFYYYMKRSRLEEMVVSLRPLSIYPPAEHHPKVIRIIEMYTKQIAKDAGNQNIDDAKICRFFLKLSVAEIQTLKIDSHIIDDRGVEYQTTLVQSSTIDVREG